MGKSFLGLVRLLVSIVPFILNKLDKTARVKNSESLFEIQILVDQIAETAKLLLELTADRDAINLLDMPKEELEEKYNLAQVYIGLQLVRMKRIHKLLEESDVLSIELPDIRDKLDELIGSKEDGLFSIGAAMQFNLILGLSVEEKDNNVDWVATTTNQSGFIKYIIEGNEENEIFDIVRHKEIVKQIQVATKGFSDVIKEYLKPAERIQCYQKAKERTESFNCRQ